MPVRYAETRNIVFLKRTLPIEWCLHESTTERGKEEQNRRRRPKEEHHKKQDG